MLRLLGLATGVLLLAGCSSEEVDSTRIEQVVERQLGRQVGGDVSVRCPEGVEWRTGEDFHCVARLGGRQGRVEVTMETDAGDISWELR